MHKTGTILKLRKDDISDRQDRSDETLMQDYEKGDHLAFELLLKRHQSGIYNFLYRFLGQGENVDEAFQEVFLRVIRSTSSYTPSAKFSTWIYTIARNYCVDHVRKARFRKTVSFDDGEEGEEKISLADRVPDSKVDLDSQVLAQDLSQKLEQALKKINPDQREVFLLREKADCSFDEISQIVGSSVNTVKSRMRYALMALREELSILGYEDFKDLN